MQYPAAKSPESCLGFYSIMHKLIFFFMFLTVIKAQNPNRQDMATGDTVTKFQPSLAVVVGVLAVMFALTFVLLLFAKCCRQQAPVQNQGGLTRSRSRFSGIDKTVIESLPFFRFSALKGSREGLECAVCLSKFQDIEILRLLPKCKHAFHIDCVDQWLEKHSSCPLCRHKVSKDDITLITNSNSLRFLQNQSDLRQDSNLELFVQRVEDNHQGSLRFSEGSSFNKGFWKEEELTIQERCDKNEEILHKFNHKIIVSDVVLLKNRWSNVSSSDLMFLKSEMINDMSNNIFESNQSKTEQYSRTEDSHEFMKIKEEMENKRVFENKVAKLKQNDITPFAELPTSSGKILGSPDKRSMSEIIVHPRFNRNIAGEASGSENNAYEERQRRLWLPIAQKTVEWFANRERRLTKPQNTRQSLDI